MRTRRGWRNQNLETTGRASRLTRGSVPKRSTCSARLLPPHRKSIKAASLKHVGRATSSLQKIFFEPSHFAVILTRNGHARRSERQKTSPPSDKFRRVYASCHRK